MKEPKVTFRIESEALRYLINHDVADITEASLCGYSEQLKKGDKVRIIDEAAGVDQISKVTAVDKSGRVKMTFIKRMK